MSLLKALKLTSSDKLKDVEFISKLKTPEILSKLLITVYDLQQEVEKLRTQVEQYENLNLLLEGEDLSKESTQATPPPTQSTTPEPPTLVEKITTQELNETMPTGFTPMFGAPAITASETLGKPQKRTVIKPWPELTLTQLATKFKIPKELLQQSSKHLSLQKRKDGLKPVSRTTKIDYLPLSKSITTPSMNIIGRQSRNSLKRQYENNPEEVPSKKKVIRVTTSTTPNTIENSTPISTSATSINSNTLTGVPTVNVLKNSANSLKYSMTSNGSYKCDSCDDNIIYNSYLDVYNHKKANHANEFDINNNFNNLKSSSNEGEKSLIEMADEIAGRKLMNKNDINLSIQQKKDFTTTDGSRIGELHNNEHGGTIAETNGGQDQLSKNSTPNISIQSQ